MRAESCARLLGLGGDGGVSRTSVRGDGVLCRAALARHHQLALISQRLELRRKLAQGQRLELGDKRDMQLAARSLHAGQLGDNAIVKLTEVFLFSCHSCSLWFGLSVNH